MTLNKKGSFFYQFLMLASALMLAIGCAVPQRPQGGPRDVQPPKLLKATPINMSHNFSSKVIQLDFDEYFKLTNQYQEITMSPAQEKVPEYRIKNKSLIITLKDSLQKNTTYVLNFGKAIADVNETNVLKNFTYVFSTGTHIDSLSIAGNVTNTLTQLREKDVTVMLFTLKQDSLLFGKKKPTVFATTDTAGNFTITNLHEGVYKLYALKETSPNKIFDNDEELIAFPTKTINLQTDTAGIQLRLFRPVPPKFKLAERKFDVDGKVLLAFNKPLDNPSVHIVYPTTLEDNKYVEISRTKDTALVYFKSMDFDSLRLSVYDGNKPIDTISLRKGRKESFTQVLTIRTNAESSILKPATDLRVLASSPLINIDQNLLVLMEDSTAVTDYTLIKDSVNLKRFSVRYPWKQKSAYSLTVNEGALTGIFGEKNKRALKRFKIDKPENYSQLTIHFTVPDTARSYIVEVYNDQKVLLRSDIIKKNAAIVYKNYITGKYHLSVVYDDNNNGKWDSGSIKEKRQPENVWVDKDVIALRANWEANETITIPREPTL